MHAVRAVPLVLLAALLSTAACGDETPQPDSQPAPGAPAGGRPRGALNLPKPATAAWASALRWDTDLNGS